MLRESTFNEYFIITGDGSRFYLRQIGHKNRSKTRQVRGGKHVLRVLQNNRFRSFGLCFKGDTIAGHYYERNFLNLIIRAINMQITDTQNFKFLHDNARPHVT